MKKVYIFIFLIVIVISGCSKKDGWYNLATYRVERDNYNCSGCSISDSCDDPKNYTRSIEVK